MPQEVRNAVGTRLLKLTLKELFHWRYMQTDPNWWVAWGAAASVRQAEGQQAEGKVGQGPLGMSLRGYKLLCAVVMVCFRPQGDLSTLRNASRRLSLPPPTACPLMLQRAAAMQWLPPHASSDGPAKLKGCLYTRISIESMHQIYGMHQTPRLCCLQGQLPVRPPS